MLLGVQGASLGLGAHPPWLFADLSRQPGSRADTFQLRLVRAALVLPPPGPRVGATAGHRWDRSPRAP